MGGGKLALLHSCTDLGSQGHMAHLAPTNSWPSWQQQPARRCDVPKGKKFACARRVVDHRPKRDEPWRLRITGGGDRLEHFGETSTPTAGMEGIKCRMEAIKCQMNNTVSMPGAKAAAGDISNMCLNSFLPEGEEEHCRFHISLIPRAFAEQCGLCDLVDEDGFVHAQINKACYGLKQSGFVSHQDLCKRLEEAGCVKAPLVEGYFYHKEWDISFTWVVDDFLINYKSKEDLDHLTAAILHIQGGYRC